MLWTYLLQCFLDLSKISVRVFSVDLLAIHCNSQSKAGENNVRYLGISIFCMAKVFWTTSFCTWNSNTIQWNKTSCEHSKLTTDTHSPQCIICTWNELRWISFLCATIHTVFCSCKVSLKSIEQFRRRCTYKVCGQTEWQCDSYIPPNIVK